MNALALVPQQRAGWFAFRATGTGSSRPMEGTAAGVGNVGIEERRNFRFATYDAVGTLAIQWKVARELKRAGRESLTIEQVMAGEMDEGRSAQIIYDAGEPTRMPVLVQKASSVPIGWSRGKGVWWAKIGFSTFVPWKSVDATPWHGALLLAGLEFCRVARRDG